MNTQTKKRLLLIFIAALFFVPLIVSFALFQQGWRPIGQTNYGSLINPAKPLTDLSTLAFETIVDKKPFQLSDLWGKWTLITIAQEDCVKVCQENLYKMRQVRLALNQNAARVRRVLLVSDPTQLTQLDEITTVYAGTLLLSGQPAFSVLTQVLRDSTDGAPHKIYVVDPLGNLMMFYPNDANPSKMLKDLERLLRLSQVG
jgi:cytochrome oxidase Cu insertion factor (SCO1/SenC/PrrC family)